MRYYIVNALALVFLGLIFIAVLWQTKHLIDWTVTLYNEHVNNGGIAGYLRLHAYTYMTWIFGNPFGWHL